MRSVAELMRLDGRVAVVTGGAGHLGAAFGETLAEAGASVAIVDIGEDACEARAAELAAMGPETLPVPANLAEPASAESVVERVLRRFGRLDILVNNAALTGASAVAGYAVPFDAQSAEAWDAAINVNLTPAFRLARSARASLEASGHGTIINIASIYGVVGPDMRLYEGSNMGNPAAYAASKGGLLQLTRYLATTLAPRVRVNAISPGGIERGQPDEFKRRYEARTPLGRMATEQDIKGALAFLASDAAAYVTGQNLIVDGGFTAW